MLTPPQRRCSVCICEPRTDLFIFLCAIMVVPFRNKGKVVSANSAEFLNLLPYTVRPRPGLNRWHEASLPRRDELVAQRLNRLAQRLFGTLAKVDSAAEPVQPIMSCPKCPHFLHHLTHAFPFVTARSPKPPRGWL